MGAKGWLRWRNMAQAQATFGRLLVLEEDNRATTNVQNGRSFSFYYLLVSKFFVSLSENSSNTL